MDLSTLKDFIDLGGTFILALAFLYLIHKKLDKIETNTDKLLVVLMILAKKLVGGNPVGDVINKSKQEIKEMLNSQ